MPGGNRNTGGTFNNVGSNGGWWTATVSGSNAYDRYMGYSYNYVGETNDGKSYGYSVRCIQN